MANEGKPNKGILNWISSIPPAVTVLGYLSLMLFVGEIGQWIQAYWFPISRAFWENTLGYFLDWRPSDAIKDYLTAITMFFPIFITSIMGRKVQTTESVTFQIATTIIALAMIFVMANNTYQDFSIFIRESAISLWDIYLSLLRPIYLFVLVPMFVFCFFLFGLLLTAQQIRGRTFWTNQTKKIIRSWKVMLAALVLLLLGTSGAYPFIQDLREGLTTSNFDFSRHIHTHSWISLYVVLPCFALLMVFVGTINRYFARKKGPKTNADQQSVRSPTNMSEIPDLAELEVMLEKLKAENNPNVDIADLERELDAYKAKVRQMKIGNTIGILSWVALILVAMFIAANNVGLTESIFSTMIISMVAVILLRAPRRLYGTFIIIITLIVTGQLAAFALSVKSWLETMSA